MAVASIASPRRITALLVLALMVLAPLLWIVWSLSAATAMAEANREQADTLASLQTRLSALAASAKGAQANTASVYLPGKSAAIAGAALQRIVANAVEGAGGRVVQSEIARPEAAGQEEEQGTVNLRAEFETDIVGLQRIVFELETGAPVLMVQAITIETKDKAAENANPGLGVIVLVRGYWET
jgi:hypothetical protein